ncbi:MAG: orotate phosphoribosyltransferase [Candidatus Deianiraeaceae bacterium]|jgi:orotate phosphoribosyltransferase
MEILSKIGAILKGHFLLSSGKHSDTYIQCAKIFEHPKIAEEVCKNLAREISTTFLEEYNIVVSPAMGGVIVGYETSKHLGIRNVFVERVQDAFELRRGFELSPKDKVIIIEDVITTGKSTLEAIDVVKKFGCEIVGCASIINRMTPENIQNFPYALVYLYKIDAKNFDQSNIPKNLQTIEVSKPGSRKKMK